MMTGIPPTEIAPPRYEFTQLFSSTRHGARLARLMTMQQLADWGWPHCCRIAQTAEIVVAELATNAALHARCLDRDFRVRLTTGPGLLAPTVLRVDVEDLLADRHPDFALTDPEAESGRGLILIEAFADRWGVLDRRPHGKTVWAELDLPTTHD
ncbi:ATP-binding protein [Streptomyces sp. URMC 129]|uniref:ATP-binding protein n=1 Tax=Streptomyces sp. URMC 129 TaxID=3423407 RepID=UPI003F197032